MRRRYRRYRSLSASRLIPTDTLLRQLSLAEIVVVVVVVVFAEVALLHVDCNRTFKHVSLTVCRLSNQTRATN